MSGAPLRPLEQWPFPVRRTGEGDRGRTDRSDGGHGVAGTFPLDFPLDCPLAPDGPYGTAP